ncbi:hypothetical protein TCAL_17107 [Tigriopus californicus]|uniref:Uncharacterized protein n=1 Tax=Tigriopus californicus TaxID=6832 RepID=A0A553P326_TIGCA|nr:hypothetical protein TCAL_17107 [Tigriopus californicus]
MSGEEIKVEEEETSTKAADSVGAATMRGEAALAAGMAVDMVDDERLNHLYRTLLWIFREKYSSLLHESEQEAIKNFHRLPCSSSDDV